MNIDTGQFQALTEKVTELEADLKQWQHAVIPFLVDVAFHAGRDSLTNPRRFDSPAPFAAPLEISGESTTAAPARSRAAHLRPVDGGTK
jgi:hypothetical protein